jgi:hypothetical protein
VERDENEQHVEGECLFLSLAHTACRAHPEHLLYPMDKKLLKGQTLGLPVGRKQTEPSQMRKKGVERQGNTPGRKKMDASFILSHQSPPPNRTLLGVVLQEL